MKFRVRPYIGRVGGFVIEKHLWWWPWWITATYTVTKEDAKTIICRWRQPIEYY